MKLKIRGGSFKTPREAQDFVRFLSATVEGEWTPYPFDPYKPNDLDNSTIEGSWVFDRSNNWRASFFKDDPTLIEIRYRYEGGTIKAEEALSAWLAYQVNATIIKE